MNDLHHHSVGWLLSLALFVFAPAVLARDEDPQKTQAARDLAEQGYELYAQNDYEAALDRLGRAYEMVPAPTIKVLEAQILVELGRLIEAREAYELVIRTGVEADATSAFVEAVEKARRELAKLKPRIPGITVVLEGERPEGLLVTIDNESLEDAAIGVRWPVDPGEHVVEVSSDAGSIARRQVHLDPGLHERVVIVLASPVEPESPDAGPEAPRRAGAWVSLGFGGAGLAVGVVSGLVMLDKKRKLDDACSDRCPADLRDTHDAFRRARNVSWVGYGVGTLGLGLGVTLLLTERRPQPEDEVPETVRVRPFVGPASVGVKGHF